MMRSLLLPPLVLLGLMAAAQVPFVTEGERFMIFSKGRFEKMEPRPPRRLFPMEGQVVYEDHEGRLKVFLSEARKLYMLQAQRAGEVKATRHQLAWLAGDTLKRLKDGVAETIALGVTQFDVQDELIVHTTVEGTRTYHEVGHVDIPLLQGSAAISGPNTILFSDTAGRVMLYHENTLHMLAGDTGAIPLAAGRDLVAWWEPGRGTMIHYEGNEHQVIQQKPVEIQAGNGLAAFRFQHSGLHCFQRGDLRMVTDAAPSYFEVAGDLLVYLLDGRLHIFGEAGAQQVETYVPEWWKVHGDLLVYLDMNREMRGIRGNGDRSRFGKEPAVTDPDLFGKMVHYTSSTGHITVVHRGRVYVF